MIITEANIKSTYVPCDFLRITFWVKIFELQVSTFRSGFFRHCFVVCYIVAVTVLCYHQECWRFLSYSLFTNIKNSP